MSMLRRFEIYSLDPKAPWAKVAAMQASMRNAQRYIPEVLHSAVGYNKSDVALHFVWEHAYESPASYQRYMVHPFHANIYDRYLLNDCPERIVTDNPYDVGLLGYSCDGPILSAGRKRATPGAAAPGGRPGGFLSCDHRRGSIRQSADDPIRVGREHLRDTLARRRDADTRVDDLQPYLGTGLRVAGRRGGRGSDWRASAGASVEKFIELWYELDAGYEG